MLLFLDVISPIPEFFLIEDNKVIFQRKIIKNQSDKLSDNIFEVYSNIDSDLNLTEKLDKIAITIGPGSYTSLRVGAAFASGLMISKKLLLCSISAGDLIKFKSQTNKVENISYFISSANNQQFLCTMGNVNKIEYHKVENNDHRLHSTIDTIFYNLDKYEYKNKQFKQYKFSFIEALLENIGELQFTSNEIIQPIYISNNRILN